MALSEQQRTDENTRLAGQVNVSRIANTASHTKLRRDQKVVYNVPTAAGTIYLPPASEMAGEFIYIKTTVGNTYNQSIQDLDGNTLDTQDAANDWTLLFCTGLVYVEIKGSD